MKKACGMKISLKCKCGAVGEWDDPNNIRDKNSPVRAYLIVIKSDEWLKLHSKCSKENSDETKAIGFLV
jgi:hypothetical protein